MLSWSADKWIAKECRHRVGNVSEIKKRLLTFVCNRFDFSAPPAEVNMNQVIEDMKVIYKLGSFIIGDKKVF